jgi:hypothetical protein
VSRPTLVAACLIVLIGIALRWYGIGGESIWFDEGFTWWHTGLSIRELMRVLPHDVSAPLYLILLHYWRFVVGDSEMALRSLSAVAACAAFVPAALVLRRFTTTPRGLLAGLLLFSLSYMQVQYAQEARFYALLSLELLTALYVITRLAERGSWPAMALLVVSSTAAMYTHNMAGFYLPALWATWLILPGASPVEARLRNAGIAGVLVALLYLPWATIVLQQMSWMAGRFWAARPDHVRLAIALPTLSGVDPYALPGTVWNVCNVQLHAETAGAVIVAVMAALGVLAFRSQVRVTAAVLVAALGPVVAIFVYSQFRDSVFVERVMIATSAFLPVLFGIAVEQRAPISRFIAGMLAMTVALTGMLSTIVLLGTTEKEDWRGAHGYVASLPPNEHRLIVFVANEGELPFSYYAGRHPTSGPERRTGVPAGFFDADPPEVLMRVDAEPDLKTLIDAARSGHNDEIVLVEAHTHYSDPRGLTRRWLDEHWHLRDERALRLVNVRLYERVK